MRKTILVAALAAMGGFCLASATAFGSARYNIWHASGPSFQLGYVIGYLDAISLSQRKDIRASIATRNTKEYDQFVRDVNTFFEDPANRDRQIPDAIYEIASKQRDEWLREWGRKTLGRDVSHPSPSPTP